MGNDRYLLFSMDKKFYLCKESFIEKIISVNKDYLYLAPFGPLWIRYLINYNGMIVPVVKEHEEILCEKMYNVVILKKVFNFVGFLIDFIDRFVNISDEMLDKAIYTPVFMAKSAIIYDGRECYLLDIDALIEGRE